MTFQLCKWMSTACKQIHATGFAKLNCVTHQYPPVNDGTVRFMGRFSRETAVIMHQVDSPPVHLSRPVRHVR